MKKISVKLKEKPYNVYIEQNGFGKLEGVLSKNNFPSRILAVVDRNILKFQSEMIEPFFNSGEYPVDLFVFNASEKNKNLRSVEKIYSALQRGNHGRDSGIIAIGGGITGDVAGFAASTYMRGIKYAHIPTTLLSAVDSSVGGKTGVNFNNSKNFIGAFYQPEFVLIDSIFFETLPLYEMVGGVGEVIKSAFLAGGKFYSGIFDTPAKILNFDYSPVDKLIFDSVQFKAGVVEKDEKEEGLRKILNFGHTFAHALEKESEFEIIHGEAVIFGIVCALNLSFKLGIMSKDSFEEGLCLMKNIKNVVPVPQINPEVLYSSMCSDKKNRDGKIKFVLLKEKGSVCIDVEVDKKTVISSIKMAYNFFHTAPVL